MMYGFSLAKACWQILLVFAGLVIPIPLHPAVPAQERDALIALYNSTDGANWKKKTHWLGAVGTECTWYGVRCNDTGSSITSLTLGFSGLGGNQLRGRIPAQLRNLTNLQSLDLGANELSGSIPSELGNLRNLQVLRLSHNQLSGRIPTQLGNLTNLHQLYLAENQLSGPIPTRLGNLTSLTFLALSSNQLSGRIPTQLGNLSMLYSLNLSYNQLSGPIPAQLGNLTNLQDLNLGSNRLSGTIPAELGNLTHLESLMLFSNQLSGPIPTRLGNLTSLTFLALSSNQLSGSIPAQLGSLPKLIRDLTISYNALYTNDSSLISSLNSKSPDWRNTQTIAPVGLAAAAQSISSIQVSWTPIVYSSGPGRYIVLRSTSSGGPYSPAGSTADKSASSLTITGLRPSTTYYFVVQTVTDPHAKNRNTVTSEYSSEVSAATY